MGGKGGGQGKGGWAGCWCSLEVGTNSRLGIFLNKYSKAIFLHRQQKLISFWYFFFANTRVERKTMMHLQKGKSNAKKM